MRIEIELIVKRSHPLITSFTEKYVPGTAEYRVRKVEYEYRKPSYADHQVELVKAKYGFSWITGEWVKVGEDGKYPDETRFVIREKEA